MATEFIGVNLQPVMPASVPPPKPWYVQYFPELVMAVDLAFVFGLALVSLYWPRLTKAFRAKRPGLKRP